MSTPPDTWGTSPTATEMLAKQQLRNEYAKSLADSMNTGIGLGMMNSINAIAGPYTDRTYSNQREPSFGVPVKQTLTLTIGDVASGYVIGVSNHANQVPTVYAGSSLEQCLNEILAEVVARKLEA